MVVVVNGKGRNVVDMVAVVMGGDNKNLVVVVEKGTQ